MVKRRNFILIAGIIILLVYLIQELPDRLKHDRVKYANQVKELHPVIAQKKEELAKKVKKKGIAILITDDFRSAAHQDELYNQGRTSGGKVVTNARGGESYHNYGLAIDFALRTKSGDVVWDMDYDGNKNGRSDWMEVVDIAKELGFEWGGDWPDFPDYPHLQMSFGLTISDLQRGEKPA
ncbi:M15 family metallopeptidase [Paenibacillus spongiae]|uniref:M15 family metallopeptidase n=1 Tax=Paenibacillus spongiae TaxID=2909671 RepID=UPI00283AA6B6|nr:M15 family metallopeptidase [Paenibacillus spongiae]